ncbi:MAG: cytochrome c [Archangiaceae bacterium]|nr:cytochrome c [Archangiaceae bacterium]
MTLPLVLLALSGGGPPKDFGPLYALAQQLEQDYVEAVEAHEAPLMDQQAAVARHAVDVAKALKEPAITAELERLAQGMARHVEALELRETFRKLERLLNAAGGFPRAPATTPDLQRAATLFSTTCAVCHGATGGGDGPTAAQLSPRPESFLSDDVVNPMSPWRAFVAITWGVHGTAMVGFNALSEAERWSLAFYVLTLRQPACTGKSVKASLRERATSTDLQLSGRFGEAALACLRRKLP